MSESAATPRRPCPECGAPLSAGIAGFCGVCLLRLATVSPEAAPGAEPASAGALEEWLQIKGQRIAGYELVAELARGGMGIVYRARQVAAGRTVAIKLMLPLLMHLPGMQRRFRLEVEAVAQLDHPNILPIYEVGEHAGLPFFSMKFAEGGSLDRRIAALRGEFRKIAAIVAGVAGAVEHAHSKGILHRDLKPANILFGANDEPLVADFGLAKFRAAEHGLTVPAAVFGSPNYMAPEQVSAQFGEPGPATDVYGIGAVLYEMLTGQPPIAGEDAAGPMRLVPTQIPRPGIELRAGVPADLDAIALKCLAKQPQDRYASAAAVARDLSTWLGGSQTQARRGSRLQRLRRTAMNIGGGALLIALVAGGGTYLQHTRDEARRDAMHGGSASAARSIAVLPLRNLGADRDDDYLSAMVTDDLLRELRQVASLNVVPFRVDAGPDEVRPADLAAQLGVDLALTGDYTRDGSILHVRARLLETRTGAATWEKSFDTPAADAREMRSTIATALVTQLQIRVGNDLHAQLQPGGLTVSPVAYSDYLRARYLLRWRRPETLAEAARLLRDAISYDDHFAEAHSALAYVYALWISTPPVEGKPADLSVLFARNAIARDPSLGEPHAVLGDYYSSAGDPVAAELQFRQAIQLDPRDPATLHFYAIHLYGMGHIKKAMEMERRSVANDGSSPQPMMWLAMATTLTGDADEARRLWQKADELGAARPLCAAIVRLDLGQNEYLDEWYRTHREDWIGAAPGKQLPVAMSGSAVLSAGVRDASQRPAALAWLHQAEPYSDRAFLITHYALLGAADDAYRLARDFDLRDDKKLLLRPCNLWSPRTASIRSDARFDALAKRWGLAEYWQRFGEPD